VLRNLARGASLAIVGDGLSLVVQHGFHQNRSVATSPVEPQGHVWKVLRLTLCRVPTSY
jgi:hypothetical protein